MASAAPAVPILNVKINIANSKANSVEEILKIKNINDDYEIINFEEGQYDFILRFLSNPAVLSILISIAIAGIYLEIKTPGFGIGGVVAIVCFFLFFTAQFFIGDSGFISPAVFVLGIMLLALEIFVIPGFGVTGIAGIIAIFASIFMSFGIANISQAVFVIFVSLIIDIILIILMARFMTKSKVFKSKMFLETDTSGYHSSESYDDLLGLEGIAYTPFRPSGNILIDDKKYDAISEGEFIQKDAKLKVILVNGNKIVVKEIKE